MARIRGESGQAAPEWVGLVLLVALVFGGLLATAHGRVPGPVLARQIAARMLCAVRLDVACRHEPELAAAYGAGTARLVREHAPGLVYERGMIALPVDFRRCRSAECAAGERTGEVTRSLTGLPVTAFVHVAEHGGTRWIQYWFYYPDSATLRGVPVAGRRGYHADDWEGLQVRVGRDGRAVARATSHNGYHRSGGIRSWASDTGVKRGPGWGPESGWLYVSGGSHAGRTNPSLRFNRLTPASDVRLVPLETLAGREGYRFAVSPPWRKAVWSDPESVSTA